MTDQKNFEPIPSSKDLEAMERKVKFHPSTVTNPRALSMPQVQQYNTLGFVKSIPIFSDEEIGAIRCEFDKLLDQVMSEGQSSYSISSAHLKYGFVYDMLTDERIVSCVKDLLGEDVIGWGSHFFCKLPGDGKRVAWHQDASYWPLSETRTVTAWVAIDDADRENACMRFLGGSHHYGQRTYRQSDPDEYNVLTQTVDNAEQFGVLVEDELKAGEISLHSDLLLHGSEVNESDRRRCGLTLRYCPSEVRAGLDWNEKGVLVAGVDLAGHWGNPPRPAS